MDTDSLALAWDLGEIYGLSNPTRLPSPTTSNLARTIIMRPCAGTITRLGIRDAERAQGLPAGYTELPTGQECNQRRELTHRFRCVGNALPGMVATPIIISVVPILRMHALLKLQLTSRLSLLTGVRRDPSAHGPPGGLPPKDDDSAVCATACLLATWRDLP
jgi:hypothetical protein